MVPTIQSWGLTRNRNGALETLGGPQGRLHGQRAAQFRDFHQTLNKFIDGSMNRGS